VHIKCIIHFHCGAIVLSYQRIFKWLSVTDNATFSQFVLIESVALIRPLRLSIN